MNKDLLKTLCEEAIMAARVAGEFVESFDSLKLKVQRKETGTSLRSQVVTQVDRLSEKLILKKLESSFKKYDLGLLTEEQEDDGSRFEKEHFWCIDPLDGTLCFAEDREGYSVSIALVSQQGEAVVGVVYNPRSKQLFSAYRGGGAFLNGEQIEMKPYRHDQSVQVINQDGAVMNACEVLLKSPAVFLKKPKEAQGGGCIWDYAATVCLYHELGCWVSDASGKPLDLNSSESLFMNHCGVLFASHKNYVKQYTL